MSPFKHLHYPISLYELAKKWGLTREESIQKARENKDKLSAYIKIESIIDQSSGHVRYIYGKMIKDDLETWLHKSGDDVIFFDRNDVDALELFLMSGRAQGESVCRGSSARELRDRAKQLLKSCDPKKRKCLEAFIVRSETGCTVQELAEQINKSKRTAELYLTEANILLGLKS